MRRRTFLKLPLALALALLPRWVTRPALARPAPGCLPASLPMSLSLGPMPSAAQHLYALPLLPNRGDK